MELSEAQVKQAVGEYLQYQQNMGKLWFCRLNAGDFIDTRVKEGHVASRRRIKGAGAGTADFIVIQGGEIQMYHIVQQIIHRSHSAAFVTFIECKSSKGKQRPEQIEFEEMVTKLNCRYAIVRCIEELEEVLKRE